MSIQEQVSEDLKAAMKAKDAAALRALRAIKTAFTLAQSAEGRDPNKPLEDSECLAALQKQAKQRKDSIDSFRKNNREDLATAEAEELAVIERYLPQSLSPQELEAAVRGLIQRLGVSGPAGLGPVMKAAKAELAGVADGEAISKVAKQLLG
jgi:uncharacterized protein YqeY